MTISVTVEHIDTGIARINEKSDHTFHRFAAVTTVVTDVLVLVFVYSLKDLDDFIQTADAGLNQPIKEGDYTGLVKVMGHVMAVKDRQAATDEMFEPLKETIELLKSYNQEMPEDVYLQLQVCIKDVRMSWKKNHTHTRVATLKILKIPEKSHQLTFS